MATIAAEMKSDGIDVVNFSVGEPDFNTPSHIINAGKMAMEKGYTKYTAGPGMIEFRKAICDKLENENGINFNPEKIPYPYPLFGTLIYDIFRSLHILIVCSEHSSSE